ncbi:MAG: hypothetical protein E6J11_03655 [Chloroflexi bacterium]|nr:MAG: hypothetical protein E6J11_03655 [Chloroflexota bacterium]
MPYVLGVDGGNTKTVALIASLDGTILGAGRGGCGDIYNASAGKLWPDSASAAVANIEYTVNAALDAAGIKAADLVTSVFNMAGADWPEDFVYLQTAMQERGFGRTIYVQNDALGVLHAGSSNDTGVSVVCGTGAATGARAPDGRTWHSSFWQDQAQGSSLMAQRALDAVYRSELGIDPPTTLTPRILDFYKLKTVEELLHLFTNRLQRHQYRIDQLTPLLLDAAQAGDNAATHIVQEQGQLLANAIIETVRTTSPAVRPTRCRFEPIIGVLFTALEAARVAVDDALLERLMPTIPGPALFKTALDYSNIEQAPATGKGGR